MPIGFVESKEKEEDNWIDDLIQHILTCLDYDCERCLQSVQNDFLRFLSISINLQRFSPMFTDF